MIEPTIKCEQCEAPRGEGNHWLELRYMRGAPYFLAWSRAATRKGSRHVCSENCAHVLLSQHLAALREKAKGAA
jgi:hypothetical protein